MVAQSVDFCSGEDTLRQGFSMTPQDQIQGDAFAPVELVGQTTGLSPLAYRPHPGLRHTHQNSVNLFAVLSRKSGQWHLSRLVEPEPEFVR